MENANIISRIFCPNDDTLQTFLWQKDLHFSRRKDCLMMKKQFLSSHPSVFRSPRSEWLDMIGYNVHSIEIGRMGSWSKLNRERGGLNTEQRNKVGILHKYRSGRVWAQCTAYKLFIPNFCKRKIFFFLYFCQSISSWVSFAVKYKCAHCSWGIINCLGLFYKIRIDSEWWRCIQTEHSLYNGKAIPPRNNIFPQKKMECG